MERLALFGKLHENDTGMDDIAFRATQNDDGTYSFTVASDQMETIIQNQAVIIALLVDIDARLEVGIKVQTVLTL